jgi:hypothetical protein
VLRVRRRRAELLVVLVESKEARNSGNTSVAGAWPWRLCSGVRAQRESSRKGESECGMRGDARAFVFGGAGSGAARGAEVRRAAAMGRARCCMADTETIQRARGGQ